MTLFNTPILFYVTLFVFYVFYLFILNVFVLFNYFMLKLQKDIIIDFVDSAVSKLTVAVGSVFE